MAIGVSNDEERERAIALGASGRYQHRDLRDSSIDLNQNLASWRQTGPRRLSSASPINTYGQVRN